MKTNSTFASLRLAALLLLPPLGITASAQIAVPAGAGSYADFPPAHEGAGPTDMLSRTIYVTDPNRAIPTNQWWTDLVVSQYAGTMWAYPLAVSANAQGVNVYYPTAFNAGGTAMATNSPLQIRGEGVPVASPTDVLIADFEATAYPAGWTKTGTAFGAGPAAGTLPGQSAVSGYLGARLVNSFLPNDASTGTLTSPGFVVSQTSCTFSSRGEIIRALPRCSSS